MQFGAPSLPSKNNGEGLSWALCLAWSLSTFPRHAGETWLSWERLGNPWVGGWVEGCLGISFGPGAEGWGPGVHGGSAPQSTRIQGKAWL